MRVATASVGLLAGGALAAHVGPYLTSWGDLRRAALPGLCGQGPAQQVALTFDDGPDPASTPAFLAELDRLGWRATFFVLGSMVHRAPALAAELVAAGHEVGLHGGRHRSHVLSTPWAVADDLRRSKDLVEAATGRPLQLFRPPYGSLSGASLLAARRLGLRTALWTAWGRDWRAEATPATVVADLRRHLRPGATLLLHDSDCTSAPGAWRSALGALPLLADELVERRLAVVPLGEHLGLPGATTQGGRVAPTAARPSPAAG